MEIQFRGELEQLYTDPRHTGGFGPAVVKAFRKRAGYICAATDQRDIRAIKGHHFEKLADRPGLFSVRLNDQWRLILSFEMIDGKETAILHKIEDYH